MKTLPIFSTLLLLLGATAFPQKKTGNESYRIETIETPPGLSAETGGIAFMPDGRLVACFHRGEVYMYDVAGKTWKLFATGLHDPLGVVALSNTDVVVMQRPELTRIRDTDGDGVADEFSTITDAFGMSGNYHEFAFGPVVDREGNFLIALNVASNGAGIRNELRGTFNPLSQNAGGARMYSCVPWRGWIMKVTPEGAITPVASGFRSPNGLGFDGEGNLYAPDNQGDWIGSSPLYHVEAGKHYGHVASLAWKPGETREPLKIPLAELDAMRTRPTIVFPQNIMANSPTQPLLESTGGKFGPFAGQMLIGEMNRPRIVRLMLEKVDGQMQGACVPFMDDAGLRKGNNRMVFAPDGSLWVGQTDHGWAGDKGIQRIVWTGKVPMDVKEMRLTKKGFELVFTLPVEAASASLPGAYKFSRYYYDYHAAYGSKQHELQDVPVTSVVLSADRTRVSVEFAELLAWRVYELHLTGIKAADGAPLVNPLVCYTLNRLLENTPPPPKPGREGGKLGVGGAE